MKVCEVCGVEIGTRDGDNRCCEHQSVNVKKRKAAAYAASRARDRAMESLGLVKVRGALGGVYWE